MLEKMEGHRNPLILLGEVWTVHVSENNLLLKLNSLYTYLMTQEFDSSVCPKEVFAQVLRGHVLCC